MLQPHACYHAAVYRLQGLRCRAKGINLQDSPWALRETAARQQVALHILQQAVATSTAAGALRRPALLRLGPDLVPLPPLLLRLRAGLRWRRQMPHAVTPQLRCFDHQAGVSLRASRWISETQLLAGLSAAAVLRTGQP